MLENRNIPVIAASPAPAIRGLALALVCAFAFSVFALSTAAAQEIRLTAVVDPPVAIAGDNLSYQVTIEGSGQSDLPAPQYPNFEPFQVIRRSSSSTRISMVMGQGQTITKTFEVGLRAVKEGNFQIPPSSVQIGGQSFQSNPVQVVVSRQAPETLPASSGAQGAVKGLEDGFVSARTGTKEIDAKLQGRFFLYTEMSKKDPVPYEPILARTYIYKSPKLVEGENYGFVQEEPPTGGDFLHLQVWRPRENLNWEPVTHGQANFQRALVDVTALIPTKTGSFTYRAPTMQSQLPVQGRRGRDPFDDPFGMFGGGRLPAEMPAPPREIKVQALPQPQPAGYQGIVGDFQVSARADRLTVKEGEILTLTLQFEGEGYAEAIPEPSLPALAGLSLFDKKSQPQTDAKPTGVRGRKTFEFLLRADRAGDVQIPALTFPLYHPGQKKYIERKTLPIQIHIAPGESKGPMVLAAANSSPAAGEVRTLASDISHIYSGAWTPSPAAASSALSNAVWWGAHFAGLMMVLGAYLHRRRREYFAEHPELIRRGRAAGVAGKRLREARNLLADMKSDRFYGETASAIRGFLGDKLGREAAGLTLDEIAQALRERGGAPERIEPVCALLNACDAARYAPPGADSPEARRALLEKAEAALNQLQEALR